MTRIVTMADFQAFKAACLQLERGTAEAAELALDGQKIVCTAEDQNRAHWAKEFSAQTVKNLEQMQSKLVNECIRAAEQFTGEMCAPWETFSSYWPRINAAISDPSCQTLHKMMARNDITFALGEP